MCGIFAIASKKEDPELINTLLEGLKRLEYRGYDSAGISYLALKKNKKSSTQNLITTKKVGEVKFLESSFVKTRKPAASIGIAHTRWATHGKPSDRNSHPHTDCTGKIAVVHNGIIENYATIKAKLKQRGHKFTSDTDTEVLAHLVEEYMKDGSELKDAVKKALKAVSGTYGIALIHADYPDQIIVAKLSSPLVIGKSKGAMYVASDPVCLGSFTKDMLFLQDHEMAVIHTDKIELIPLNGNHVSGSPAFEKQNELGGWEGKGKFKHFMLKEIYDQPQTIEDGLKGRIDFKNGTSKLGGIETVQARFSNTSRIVMVACGTALYAAEIIASWFEEITKIPARVEDAGELRNKTFVWYPGDTAVFVSQSGETADLLASLKIAKENGALCLGLINVVGSSIARETDAGVYLRAGPEIGVASTKAFTAQLLAGFLMALNLARQRNRISKEEGLKLISELELIPRKIRKILNKPKGIQAIANDLTKSPYIIFIGRGLSQTVSKEGALKMKEISYIFSDGLSAAGIKHGHIALISPEVTTVAICPDDHNFDKTVSNIHEIRARDGKIIAVTNKKSKVLKEITDKVINVPEINPLLSPFMTVIPLQLLAYYTALKLKRPIDKPRNLAKSVTVE